MKKLLSVLLAVIMIFSCCTLAVNALYLEDAVQTKYVDNVKEKQTATTYTNLTYSDIVGADGLISSTDLQNLYGVTSLDKLTGNDFIEVVSRINTVVSDEIRETEPMFGGTYASYYTTSTKQLEVLGFPVGDLYNKPDSSFLWKNLTAHPENALPKEGVIFSDITKADVSLMLADVNMFALKILKSLYSDYRFYTDENAVKCINLIGNIFYNDFRGYSKGSKVFSERDYLYTEEVAPGVIVSYADEDVFFQKVADFSGLSDLIQNNWVGVGEARAQYRELISLIGVPNGTLLESDYSKGDKMAPAILKFAFTKIMGEGPINYFIDIFESLTKSYLIYYYTPIKLLFTQKMHLISEEEMRTLTGLLNLIFNGNDSGNTSRYQFAPLPEARLAKTYDTAEFYLLLIVYFNMNSHYLGNEGLMNNFCVSLSNSAISDEKTVDEEGNEVLGYKTRLINIVRGLTGDDIEGIFYNGVLDSLTIENLAGKPDEYFGNIQEAISRIVKKIADWLQMWIDILTGELEFGAGAFE